MQAVIDTTLRALGGSRPAWLPARQRELLEAVAAAGVEEFSLGGLAGESGLPAILAAGRSLPGRPRLWVECSPAAHAVEEAAGWEPDGLVIVWPVSHRALTITAGRSRHWVLSSLPRLVRLARDCGVPQVTVALIDALRADASFVAEVARRAEAARADRIRLEDSEGVGAPEEVADAVRQVRVAARVAVTVRTSNRFGLATANAIAALDAGAAAVEAALLGLDPPAGTARLCEVLAFLTALRARPYDYLTAGAAATRLAGWLGRRIAADAPVVGPLVEPAAGRRGERSTAIAPLAPPRASGAGRKPERLHTVGR